MNLLSRISLLIAVLFVTSSCTERMQPVYNAENVALPPVFETAPLSDITEAIERGVGDAGWKVKSIAPQELEATLKIRVHTAIVRIPYSQSEYSITYKSSSNLPYTGTRIHKNYNIWIERLKTKINNNLQLKALEIRSEKDQISDSPEVSWSAKKDSDNVIVLRELLRKHQDSSYVPYAIKRLNEMSEGKQLAQTRINDELMPLPSRQPGQFCLWG